MISQRQAAPSRYQHIISGLVQPLNHARHRNPLVSVTFSPTQETRSQSAIWMLCPLSFHFPYRFFFSSIPQDPSKHRLTIDFSFICCILCVSRRVWPAISLCILSTFYHLRSSKNIFPHHALAKKMYSIQGNLAVGEVTRLPVSCQKRTLWCDNLTAYIILEIDVTSYKKCIVVHINFLFHFACMH